MNKHNLDHLVAPLFRDNPLSEDELVAILRQAHRVDQRDIEIVDTLVPGVSRYLFDELRSVVRADIDAESAKAKARSAQQRIGRYRKLLPTLFQYLKFEHRTQAINAISRIDDCCHDFPFIEMAGRRDANKRKIVQTLTRARIDLNDIKATLAEIERYISVEFNELSEPSGIDDNASAPILTPDAYAQLTRQVQLAEVAVEIQIHKIDDMSDEIYVSDNRTKFHVVDCAYDLTRIYGGPPLVTTPGSEFAFVCGLIYEMASGVAEESMAGAINRFAVSEERQEADDYDAEYSEEREAELLSDNFSGVKKEAKRYLDRAARYTRLSGDKELSRAAIFAAQKVAELSLRYAKQEMEQFGPFLLFADQFSAAEIDRREQESRDMFERMREVDILQGRVRRELRSYGLPD